MMMRVMRVKTCFMTMMSRCHHNDDTCPTIRVSKLFCLKKIFVTINSPCLNHSSSWFVDHSNSFTLLTEIFFLQLSNIFHMMCVHRKPGLGQFHMSWVRFHMFSLRVSDTDWSSAPAPGSSVVTVVTYRNQWLVADHAQDTQRQLTKYFLVWNNFQFRTEFSVYFTLLCSNLRDQLLTSFNNSSQLNF